jgi:hypothetical protein
MKAVLAMVVAVALGVLFYRWTLPQYEAPVRYGDQAAAILAQATIRMPEKDYFGKPMPKGKWIGHVLIGKGCLNCDTEPREPIALAADEAPIIYFVSTDRILSGINLKSVTPNSYMVLDYDQGVLPRSIYRVAPIRFTVDAGGRITGCREQPDPLDRKTP